MKVGRLAGGYDVNKRRHTRYTVDKPAELEIPAAAVPLVHAELVDISVGGTAIHTDAKLANDDFVRLRVEGMKPVLAQVVRTYEGGAALKFQMDEMAEKRLKTEIDEMG
jgi:hypothetical protein